MLRNIFPLIFSLCIFGSTSAQTIYLKMDENCMDRLEYDAGNSTNPYVSYSFKLGTSNSPLSMLELSPPNGFRNCRAKSPIAIHSRLTRILSTR
ncbi:MAG: hypothetical protein IPM82_07100 [Saprospiraceae bacterium]|nr:hypothetical protein [Saprospiraceae bacterium]